MSMAEPTGLHLEIFQFLAERFTGAESATPREKILAQFNFYKQKSVEDRVFREVVSELVRDFHKAICTAPRSKDSPGGYFVARTASERDAAIAHLRAIGAANFERAKALEAADPAEPQERLF